MVQFLSLLSRLDTSALQEILGLQVVRLVSALRPSSASQLQLRKLVLNQSTPAELLSSPETRGILFDALRPSEASELLALLGEGQSSNPFDELRRVSFNRGSSRFLNLHQFFGVVPEDLPTVVTPKVVQLNPSHGLFPHQRAALAQALPLLSHSPYRCLLHMPTGSGKTRTAMSLVAQHLNSHEPTVVLWLATSEELCQQAIDEFNATWARHGFRSIDVHPWWGKAVLPKDPPIDAFVVAGLAKLHSRHMESATWLAWLGDKTTLIIFDEAHQAIAPTYRSVVETLVSRRESTSLLGLSATPGRTWNDIGADTLLSDYFGKNKVKLSINGYSSPVDYLIAEGYLAKPKTRRLESMSTEVTESDRFEISRRLEIPGALLRRLGDDHLRNLIIVQDVIELSRRHRRILVFASTVQHAAVIAAVLCAAGVDARSVSANTAPLTRGETIDWYLSREGTEARVLTNFGVLTTGFDAPVTSAVVIARPTMSLVLYSQMVGRGLRGPKAGGNETAEIVTVVDTGLPGFRNLSETFENWEDVWSNPGI